MSERVSDFPYKKKKRKKKSYKQTLKGMKKGVDLEADVREYFIRILIQGDQEFNSLEDRRVFADNAMDQVTGNEVVYSSNQLVSRAIEKLLPFTSATVLMRFMDEFGKDLRPICCDSYCSHVLQQLILVVAKHVVEDEMKIENERISDTDFKQFCVDWLVKVSRFVLNNVEEFAWNSCANHVIRTLISILAGSVKYQNNTECRVQKIEIGKTYKPPDEFINLLKDFASRVISWSQFADLAHNCLTSVLLQDLMKGLKLVDKKLMAKLTKRFLSFHFANEESNGEFLPEIFYNDSGMHILETIVEVSGKVVQSRMYNQCFCRRLVQLSQRKNTNFVVQKLLAYCKDKTLFETIADELLPHIEEILSIKHTGILLNLCQACERFATKQDDFIKSLRKALTCSDPETSKDHFIICVLKLSKYMPNMTKDDFIHLHGSLILQSMLRFRKPIQVVNSLLSVKPDLLAVVLSDSKGSHIADAFAASPFIGQKSHEKLIKHLLGYYVRLATSKLGSRSFDAIWSIATLRYKAEIASELCAKGSLVTSNKYGQGIARKILLSAFRNSKENWQKAISETDNKRKLFSNIIGD